MRVLVLGLGKLGYPYAVALAQSVDVIGYDINPDRMRKDVPCSEQGYGGKSFAELQEAARLTFAGSIAELAEGTDLIFIIVQTPHDPRYDGTQLYEGESEDFDYTYLKQAVSDLAPHVKSHQVVVVVSTCLPGTCNREIVPMLQGKCGFVYSPAFPAMGTAIRDMMQPEFVLLGGNSEDKEVTNKVAEFWVNFFATSQYGEKYVIIPSVLSMSIESAELAKVYYNALIGQKLIMANVLGEICHNIPQCDVDDVTRVLKSATRRIMSPAYMDAGGLDGGGCHPRDQLAMSALAKRLFLSVNPFDQIIRNRQEQAEWYARLARKYSNGKLPLVILGKAYKPNSTLTEGSWATLLARILSNWGTPFIHRDYLVDGTDDDDGESKCYFIATAHDYLRDFQFPKGSIVIDPYRMIDDQEGVQVIRIGEQETSIKVDLPECKSAPANVSISEANKHTAWSGLPEPEEYAEPMPLQSGSISHNWVSGYTESTIPVCSGG